MKVPVNAIEVKNGEFSFNLACDGANVDPIRAARLIKQGKLDEIKELESHGTYTEDDL